MTARRPVLAGMKRTAAPWADPAAKPLVRFDRVSRRFGDIVAIDALSLDIFPGEFLKKTTPGTAYNFPHVMFTCVF